MGLTNHLLDGMILQVQAHFEIGVLFLGFVVPFEMSGPQDFSSIFFGTLNFEFP